MTCLGALYEAARREVSPDKRYMLQGAATLLQQATAEFAQDQTMENMVNLNGVWSYARRVLATATPETDPQPPMQVERRAA